MRSSQYASDETVRLDRITTRYAAIVRSIGSPPTLNTAGSTSVAVARLR